ncbi:MAG: histidine phosphatase family protein [Bacteroidetes bacterium]|nr:histidine phosphatase family protein [Bacteroidota bacterium]
MGMPEVPAAPEAAQELQPVPSGETRDFYLVRHGETDYNRKRIVQGRGVNAPLNPKGQEQSRLFHRAYVNVDFEHVFVSSLLRTQQTAAPFIDQGIPWSAHPELDEIDWGHREGKKADAAMRQEYARVLEGWTKGALDVSIPGGETPLDVQQRMLVFVNHWKQHAPARSLVVCHGRAMRVLLCVLLQRPLEHMEHFEHGNMGLYHLRYQSGTFSMLLRNSDRHLRANASHD